MGLGLGLGGSDAAVEGGRTVTKKTSFNWKENSGGETQQQQQQQPEQQQQAAAPQAAVLGLVSKQKAGIRGRTLVELQQARAGGRPLSAVADNSSGHHGLGHGNMNISPKRPFREHAMAANRGDFGPPAVWDPEQDEMPSPFLVRRKVMAGGVGGGGRTQTA